MAAKKTTKSEKPASRDPSAEERMKELEKRIGKVPLFFKGLMEKEPEMHKMVLKFDEFIWEDGALSKQTKKIIAIAVAAALRDQHAVRAQLAGASKLGIRKEEIEEALRVTFLLSGMPAYVYGRTAMDEIIK